MKKWTKGAVLALLLSSGSVETAGLEFDVVLGVGTGAGGAGVQGRVLLFLSQNNTTVGPCPTLYVHAHLFLFACSHPKTPCTRHYTHPSLHPTFNASCYNPAAPLHNPPPHHLRDCRSLIFKPHDACYISIRLRPRRQDPIAQCGDDQSTSQVFGVDVESMKPGDVATITADTLGYPLQLVRLLKECAVDVITAPISILLVQ